MCYYVQIMFMAKKHINTSIQLVSFEFKVNHNYAKLYGHCKIVTDFFVTEMSFALLQNELCWHCNTITTLFCTDTNSIQ